MWFSEWIIQITPTAQSHLNLPTTRNRTRTRRPETRQSGRPNRPETESRAPISCRRNPGLHHDRTIWEQCVSILELQSAYVIHDVSVLRVIENANAGRWILSPIDYINRLTLSPQEWSNSNFPCSLTRNITSNSTKNLAFHLALYYQFSRHHSFISLCNVRRMCLLNLGVKGLRTTSRAVDEPVDNASFIDDHE